MNQTINVEDRSNADSHPSTMAHVLSEDEKKRLESPLILGTTYTLNQSETKKVSIGLQLRADGSIHPIVKLQNNSTAYGVTFESEAWNLLQSQLPAISKFFDGSQKASWGSGWRTPAPLRIVDCEVVFTSSFGAKSVAFNHRVDENPAEKEEEDEGFESPAKKRRRYSPAIVMQKPSFEGLIGLMVCTDERFRRLQRNVEHVQKCVNVLCAELLMHIPANEDPETVDDSRVKDLIKHNFKSLKEAVKRRLDASFIELTFGIVFLELTVLGIPFIVNEMKKALIENKNSAL